MRYATARNLLFIDELTGLFNYRYLDVALEREIKRAERYGSSVTVIFIDLDLFKGVNDKFGHLVGSRVLNEVGKLLDGSLGSVFALCGRLCRVRKDPRSAPCTSH